MIMDAKKQCHLSLQSGPDFCNLQSGCKTNLLIKREISQNPDCRLQSRKSGLQSGKSYIYQSVDVELRLYCRHPCYYITGGSKHPLLSNAVTGARNFAWQGGAK